MDLAETPHKTLLVKLPQPSPDGLLPTSENGTRGLEERESLGASDNVWGQRGSTEAKCQVT